MSEKYVLATGEEAAFRLGILNEVHGPDTRAFLQRAGLKPGLRVADIGCGVGVVSCWMAEQIGPSGDVMGVDISAEQVAEAQKRAASQGLTNTRFVEASGYQTGLESESFDLVFSRFMLMHLQRPEEALREMRRILKPGGVLAVEDGDMFSPFCWPPSAAFDRCLAFYQKVGEQQSETFDIGLRLYSLVRQAGFPTATATLAQPVIASGDAKRLPEWTLLESIPAIEEAGLGTRAEVEAIAAELARLAQDDMVVFGMARVMQVIGNR